MISNLLNKKNVFSVSTVHSMQHCIQMIWKFFIIGQLFFHTVCLDTHAFPNFNNWVELKFCAAFVCKTNNVSVCPSQNYLSNKQKIVDSIKAKQQWTTEWFQWNCTESYKKATVLSSIKIDQNNSAWLYLNT